MRGVLILQHEFVREDVGDMFLGKSDEELARLALKKQPHAFSELLNRYTRLMLYKISCVRSGGSEADDFMQECSLGLLDAVESYSAEEKASFRTYAGVCMDNRLKTALRKSASEKNKPLRGYVEISDYLEGSDADNTLGRGINPEEQMLINESAAELKQRLKELLSKKEHEVFSLYLSGRSYEEISKAMGVSLKTVDNALQRVRRKLKAGLK